MHAQEKYASCLSKDLRINLLLAKSMSASLINIPFNAPEKFSAHKHDAANVLLRLCD